MKRPQPLPLMKNEEIVPSRAPAYKHLVESRSLMRAEKTEFGKTISCERAFLVAPLPPNFQGSELVSKGKTYSLFRRSKDGYISALGMFCLAFPIATTTQWLKELEFVKMKRKSVFFFEPDWVPPELALELAVDYGIFIFVRALLDPTEITRKGGGDYIRPPPKFDLEAFEATRKDLYFNEWWNSKGEKYSFDIGGVACTSKPKKEAKSPARKAVGINTTPQDRWLIDHILDRFENRAIHNKELEAANWSLEMQAEEKEKDHQQEIKRLQNQIVEKDKAYTQQIQKFHELKKQMEEKTKDHQQKMQNSERLQSRAIDERIGYQQQIRKLEKQIDEKDASYLQQIQKLQKEINDRVRDELGALQGLKLEWNEPSEGKEDTKTQANVLKGGDGSSPFKNLVELGKVLDEAYTNAQENGS